MRQKSWVLCLVLLFVGSVAKGQGLVSPKPVPIAGVRLSQLLTHTWHIVAYSKFFFVPNTCHDATVTYRRQANQTDQLRADFSYCKERNPQTQECTDRDLKGYSIRRKPGVGSEADWQSGGWDEGAMDMDATIRWVDHWVVYIDPHKLPNQLPDYFVIGGESGKRVFIYKADGKPMPWATYQEILQALRARGFEPGTMVSCKQSLETPSK